MACYTYRMHSTPPSKNSVFVKVNQVTGHMGIGHTGHFVQCFTRVTLANDPASAPVYKTLSHRSWQCKLSEAANYHTIITDESNVKYKKKQNDITFLQIRRYTRMISAVTTAKRPRLFATARKKGRHIRCTRRFSKRRKVEK